MSDRRSLRSLRNRDTEAGGRGKRYLATLHLDTTVGTLCATHEPARPRSNPSRSRRSRDSWERFRANGIDGSFTGQGAGILSGAEQYNRLTNGSAEGNHRGCDRALRYWSHTIHERCQPVDFRHALLGLHVGDGEDGVSVSGAHRWLMIGGRERFRLAEKRGERNAINTL